MRSFAPCLSNRFGYKPKRSWHPLIRFRYKPKRSWQPFDPFRL